MHPLPRLFLILLLLKVSISAATTPPPWAYGFKEPLPENYTPPRTATTSPVPAKHPTDLPMLGLPGSTLQFTRAEITNIFGPSDWYPQDHPPAPDIVTKGRSPDIWACARCHYVNGRGRPENAPLAGLPRDYFIEQLLAFRSGERHSADPRKPNTSMMAGYAHAMTDEEMRAAADYFAQLTWSPWIRVVETAMVPATKVSAGMFLPVPDAPAEAIGDRILEIPEDEYAVEFLRSPRVGFIAYVPVGSIKRGEELVTSGGGRTAACAACHGPDYRGMLLPDTGHTPGIAGRSPSYVVRQLFDIQAGTRHGLKADLMKPVVANLTPADMLAIAAYLASRQP